MALGLPACVGGPGAALRDEPAPLSVPTCGVSDMDATVGLRLCAEGVTPGLTLIAPTRSRSTYLIDELGRVVNSWESAWTAGLAAYLTPEGTLLRTGKGGQGFNERFGGLAGASGIVEEYGWDGELLDVWQI